MAQGLLGNCKPANATETLIYASPANKKSVGTLTILSSEATADSRASVIITSGNVSGSQATALAGSTSGTTFAVYKVLVKAPTQDDGIPVTISGIVLSEGQKLVAYSDTGSNLHYTFNGIEEAV